MPNSWNIYQSFVNAFHRHFEVLEKNEYPTYDTTDTILNKNRSFTLGDMERLFTNTTTHWPLPITCPKCKNSLNVGHLEWDTLTCTFCRAEVERLDWILKGFEK